MPRKQKTSKRLDNLFKDIRPEDEVREPKSKPKVQKEAPPPADPKPAPRSQAVSTPLASPVKRQPPRLAVPDIVAPAPSGAAGAVFATNFQIGESDWAVLRLIDERQGRIFTTDEQLLIKQVTDQLSLALENARLFQETQKRAQELAAVNQVVTSISGSLELIPTLQTIAESLVNLFSANRVGIALMNEEKTHLVIQADASKTFEKSHFIGALGSDRRQPRRAGGSCAPVGRYSSAMRRTARFPALPVNC
ncbi:MAG: GAF domain-containing protein [Chloroflexi bacterium]|nr:GAF domain-containing protein [Chloroflexota bacterium]